eukprot:scaffold94875_cov66-Phaeocystis_antarctica.AAC.2
MATRSRPAADMNAPAGRPPELPAIRMWRRRSRASTGRNTRTPGSRIHNVIRRAIFGCSLASSNATQKRALQHFSLLAPAVQRLAFKQAQHGGEFSLQRRGRCGEIALKLAPCRVAAVDEVRDALECDEGHAQLLAGPRDRRRLHLLDRGALARHQLQVERRRVERVARRHDAELEPCGACQAA